MAANYRKLNLAFYDASDGPRIMIFGPLGADFQGLQATFRNLSLRKETVELHCQPFIKPFGGIRLVASSVGSMFQSGEGKPQGVRCVGPPDCKEFVWLRTAEGWDYLAELIDGLVQSVKPGHQYLSSYPREDAIVVLSKGEYGEEVVKRLEG